MRRMFLLPMCLLFFACGGQEDRISTEPSFQQAIPFYLLEKNKSEFVSCSQSRFTLGLEYQPCNRFSSLQLTNLYTAIEVLDFE